MDRQDGQRSLGKVPIRQILDLGIPVPIEFVDGVPNSRSKPREAAKNIRPLLNYELHQGKLEGLDTFLGLAGEDDNFRMEHQVWSLNDLRQVLRSRADVTATWRTEVTQIVRCAFGSHPYVMESSEDRLRGVDRSADHRFFFDCRGQERVIAAGMLKLPGVIKVDQWRKHDMQEESQEWEKKSGRE